MTQADSVHSTPPTNTSALTPIPGLDWLDIKADTPPAEVFRAIGRLRREARDEIERLIRFLDESDDHMELEPSLSSPERHYNQCLDEIEDGQTGLTDDCEFNGDEEDASYPEGGCRGLKHPFEDDEEDDVGEDDGTAKPECEDEGAQCDDEGVDDNLEPEHEGPAFPEPINQTVPTLGAEFAGIGGAL
jgi:hypothetical protein